MRNYVIASGRKIFFESRVDPAREAGRILSVVDAAGTDIFILFGYTTRHLLSGLVAMCRATGMEKHILCCDPDGGMLSILREEAPESLDYPGLRFFNAGQPRRLEAYIEGIFYSGRHYPFHYKLLKNASITANWPAVYSELETAVAATFKTLYSNLLIMDRFKHLWMWNMKGNLERLIGQDSGRFHPLSALEGGYKGRTALIVNAGPSLDSLHGFLRDVRNKVCMIAVDTALRNLLLAGIEPDFVISLDSQLYNYQDFTGCVTGKTCLVMEVTASRKIPDLFKGQICYFYTRKVLESEDGAREIVEPHYGFFAGQYEGASGLQSGGSVSATALDFALYCGFSRIVFAGLDLAFTDQRLYCRSTYVDRLRMMESFRFHTYDSIIGRHVIEHGGRYAGMNPGTGIRTSAVMDGYRRWFRDAAAMLEGRLLFLAGSVPPPAADRMITEKELLSLPPVAETELRMQPFKVKAGYDSIPVAAGCRRWLDFKGSERFGRFMDAWQGGKNSFY